MATIVTAFMTNINRIDFRSAEKYIELGKKLLSQSIPTVCFLEKEIYDKYFLEDILLYPYTSFQLFERNDNYLMKYESQLTQYRVDSDNPTKDTPGYMFTQCHKTEWVKLAIESNPFNTTDFIWIDFGIFHMIRDDMAFAVHLEKMTRKKYDRIRIASCTDPNGDCHTDIYHRISWFFAGSVFGGPAQKLVEFADMMKEICLELIDTRQHLMWEINIWYLLHKRKPEIFDPYRADHNISIMDHY